MAKPTWNIRCILFGHQWRKRDGKVVCIVCGLGK